jgi:toxin ParE1/3/4
VKIERHPAVIGNDLPGIYAYIARDNPAAAEKVLEAIEGTFLQLTQQPLSGMLFRTRNSRLAGIRMLPVTGFENYLVFYRADAFSVRLLYVVHGARDLPRLSNREPRA